MSVKPIPEGYRTVTPYLIVKGASELIRFIQEAFQGKVLSTHHRDGYISHAELQIGDSRIMIGEAMGEYLPMPTMLYLYVEDVDKVFASAVRAGGESLVEPMNMFYGDRSGGVKDKSGNQWWIATHIEDVPEEELQRRQQEQMKVQQS